MSLTSGEVSFHQSPRRRIRDRGLPVVPISHNMPQLFEIADRLPVQRPGRQVALLSPREASMSDAVAITTGALPPPPEATGAPRGHAGPADGSAGP